VTDGFVGRKTEELLVGFFEKDGMIGLIETCQIWKRGYGRKGDLQA